MGSLVKEYKHEKLFGKVYTPAAIVEKMLDEIGYNSPAALGKTLLDPACGDGQFLVAAAKRIIALSPRDNLKENLECLRGWDIDRDAVSACRDHLDSLTADLGIAVNWRVSTQNALTKLGKTLFSDANETFDFIIGNPPYIRIQHLRQDDRRFIQTHYDFCKYGSTDIFIAFFELAYHLLSEGGICALITPNTYFYTETAGAMRRFFAEKRLIRKIINYGHLQLFENATTYSAITVFTKQSNDAFEYQKAVHLQEFLTQTVPSENLTRQSKWRFSFDDQGAANSRKLGDICSIHVGITTLCDKAYIFPIDILDERLAVAHTKFKGDVVIERALLRPIVKGSKLKRSNEPIKEYVLFPYDQQTGKAKIIPEKELAERYPRAYAYLCSIRDILDKRDNGKPNPVAWYAFGRSQNLDSSFGEKIIFSPMNHKPNFIYYPNPAATVYSGYFIKYSGDYAKLLAKLNSPEMQRFIEQSSRDFRGQWKAYSKKSIEDFPIDGL